jgi:KaiC/GvpD/RAD55 family RecA-like ATPase
MGDDEQVRRCDYCRLPIPKEPRTLAICGDEYQYCSDACRDAARDADRVFTAYHGHRRFKPGVSVLDASLPQGIPRNSFVMLTEVAGTRSEAIQAELVWRALQRGEPVVVMTFLEPPVSFIQTFATLEWNVLPYLEDDQLHVIDCFTYRVSDEERMFDRLNNWNRHLSTVAEGAVTRVRDPTEVSELESRLDSGLEQLGMADQGIVVIDSLTEFGSLVQPIQAYDFLKDVRAEVCKGRFVPIFAGATVAGEDDVFPHDMDYMVDGIVELTLNQEIVKDALVKQIRVRKMNGVLTYPDWKVYEYTSGKGIVTFDPVEQMERSEASATAETEDEGGTIGGPTDGGTQGGKAGGSGADDRSSR